MAVALSPWSFYNILKTQRTDESSDYLGLQCFLSSPMLACVNVRLSGCGRESFFWPVSSCLSLLTRSPCRAWPASAWLCARAAAGRSRTATTCWPWTSSGTCAASSAASANSTWSLSSPASARTGASSARRTTTGRRAHRAWTPTVHHRVSGSSRCSGFSVTAVGIRTAKHSRPGYVLGVLVIAICEDEQS